MDIKEIIEMIELFQTKRVPYIRNYILNPPKNHHAIIGQWARWWIEDTNDIGAVRGVFDEATSTHDGKRADIMFLERTAPNYFKIKGIAEIENNAKEYIEKLDTLNKYCTKNSVFLHLEFVILSIIKNGSYDFSSLLQETKRKSEGSNAYWIIFVLRVDNKTPRECWVPNRELYSDICFMNTYEEQGAYAIFQNGKELTKKYWDE